MAYLKQLLRHPSSIILAGSLFAAFLVRTMGLWPYALGGDEMQFLIIAKGATMQEIWGRGLAELHPPLAHIIRHYLLFISDDGYVQRLFSVVAGLIAVYGIYRFARLAQGETLGIIAVVAMAFFPVPVMTSTTIRNYAFFMAFLSWALYFFIRYERQHKTRDLACFAALLWLACACHFSGFFVAAACGLHQGLLLLHRRHWRELTRLCIAYVPLTALAALFYRYYLAPGTAGPIWEQLTKEVGFLDGRVDALTQIMALLYAPIVPILLPFTHTATGTLFVSIISIALLVLLYFSIRMLWRHNRSLLGLCALMWAIGAVMLLGGLSPGAAGRHLYYLFPCLIILYGAAIQPRIQALLVNPQRAGVAALALVLAAFGLGQSGYYYRLDPEFGLKQRDLIEGQSFLQANLKPSDRIFAGRLAGYFYLLYDKDAGKTPYDPYGDVAYMNGSVIVGPFNPPSKPHRTSEPFYQMLRSQMQDRALLPSNRAWFVTYSYRNVEMEQLLACPEFANRLDQFFSRDGALVFSITVPNLKAFLNNKRIWDRCFEDYKPMIVAQSFNAYADPRANDKRDDR
ncbi:MAG: glycosyltransferase family 39 protein [Rickettsiales bacterium]|nr:glycosyltransferase family 39 protein [Rickettsiales bacterium]